MIESVYVAHRLPADQNEIFLYPISDVHYGHPLFSEKHLTRILAEILHLPNAYVILNGDLCECALRESKGDVYHQTPPDKQLEWIIAKFEPIKHRILAMTAGNHENRIADKTGIDICAIIARQLHVFYRNEGAMVKIEFGDNNNSTPGKPYVCYVYATHGYGGARTTGAKIAKGERSANNFQKVKLVIMSHDHQAAFVSGTKLEPDDRTSVDEDGFRTGKMRAVTVKILKSNAFLKWGGYSERGGYPPVDLDPCYARIYGNCKDTKVQVIG